MDGFVPQAREHVALGVAGREWARAGEPQRRWVVLGHTTIATVLQMRKQRLKLPNHNPQMTCWGLEHDPENAALWAWGVGFQRVDPLSINELQAPHLHCWPLPSHQTPCSSHAGPGSFLPRVLCTCVSFGCFYYSHALLNDGIMF